MHRVFGISKAILNRIFPNLFRLKINAIIGNNVKLPKQCEIENHGQNDSIIIG